MFMRKLLITVALIWMASALGAQTAPENTTKTENENLKKPAAKVFTIVDAPAEYPGGPSALMQFIQSNIIYPDMARNANISGKCHLKFVIDELGGIGNVEVLKGVSGCLECDMEAIRVIKSLPKWTPAKVAGRAVSCYFSLPIRFTAH